MAVPTGPAPTPLLIIIKNIGIDVVQTRMKFLNSACDFLEFPDWNVSFTKTFVPVFNHYIYRICYPSLS